MPNEKDDILIVLADDGNVYKLERGTWKTAENQVSDDQTIGVIKRLADYGVLLADIPDDIGLADGLNCKLVNIGALKKLDE